MINRISLCRLSLIRASAFNIADYFGSLVNRELRADFFGLKNSVRYQFRILLYARTFNRTFDFPRLIVTRDKNKSFLIIFRKIRRLTLTTCYSPFVTYIFRFFF